MWLAEMNFAELGIATVGLCIGKAGMSCPTSGIKLPISVSNIDCCTLKELQLKPKEIKEGTPKLDGGMHFFVTKKTC